MIPKLSSKQLMDVLEKTEDQVDELRENVSSLQLELNRQLSVFGDAMEFAAHSIGRFNEELLQDEAKSNTTFILVDQEKIDGTYEKYGLTVVPYSTANKGNVFNMLTAVGPVYKNNANVYLNEEVSPVFTNMLMHDAIKGKENAFDEMVTDEFTIKIEVNPNEAFSAAKFNTLELLPHIPGSFDITGIRVFTMQDYRTQATLPSININTDLTSAGACRIYIGKTVELYSCEIDIKVRFQNAAGKYPFGLKHLYFLNSNYNPDSYMVFKVSRNRYVDWVSDDIVIHDQDGVHVTTCTEEDIKLYMSYEGGVLGSEIVLSKGMTQNTLPRNVYDFYVRVPIKKGIISLKFKTIGER